METPHHDIVLVRHGETDWSRTGRHTGRTDVPLNERGRVRAEALAPRLAGRAFALVLTSPLSRAVETCRLAGLGDRAEVDGRLAEWDYGAYEGRTTDEIRAERPGWSLWGDGVPGGETIADVGARADAVVSRVEEAEGDVAVFAHGHVLRVLAARWLGLAPADGRLFALDPASVSVLGREHEWRVLRSWNEPSPLVTWPRRLRRGRTGRNYRCAVSSEPASARTKRPFCSAVSSASDEPLAATASRVDHWILVEHRGAWGSDPLDDGVLSAEVKRAPASPARGASSPAAAPRQAAGTERRSPASASSSARRRPAPSGLFELTARPATTTCSGSTSRTCSPGTAGRHGSVDDPLYVVCTHGKRDRCCALHGRPLYDALRQEADPERVWQSTHIGGDRFAGNVVVLPFGLYYGRVDPAEAGRGRRGHGRREVLLDRYRGRSAYPFPVQAAESALRESEGLHGIDDLEHVASTRAEDGWQIRFRTRGEAIHEVHVVEVVADEPVFLTCDSVEEQHAHRWVAVGVGAVVSR